MAHQTLEMPDADEARSLFGPRDKNLRKVRKALGVDVIFRDGTIHLEGSNDAVRQAKQVLSELRGALARTGDLTEGDVAAVLDGTSSGEVPSDAKIELLDRSKGPKAVTPRTAGQAGYVEAMKKNDLVFCLGPAGSGKTYLAVAMAVNALRREQVRKIVLARPAVEAGEKLGFLPGDMLEKVNPFLRPLLDALEELLGSESAARYKERDVIEVVPLAFMRGRTLNDTFIILDEAQNTTVTQMKMFLTRMGVGSKIVVTGDATQNDLPVGVTSGLTDAADRLCGAKGIGCVELKATDIVRHPLVKRIVEAYDGKASTDNELPKGRR